MSEKKKVKEEKEEEKVEDVSHISEDHKVKQVVTLIYSRTTVDLHDI